MSKCDIHPAKWQNVLFSGYQTIILQPSKVLDIKAKKVLALKTNSCMFVLSFKQKNFRWRTRQLK